MSLNVLQPCHNNLGLNLVTPPTSEPVSLDEMKEYLRQDHDAEDELITAFITAARITVEEWLRRALINQTWEMYLDYFPGSGQEGIWSGVRQGTKRSVRDAEDVLIMPRSPLSSVTSISTFAIDDTESTFASTNYTVDTQSDPGRIFLKDGAVWPDDLRDYHAVKITFVAGYGANAASVPQSLKLAVKMMAAQYYEHRGDEQDKVPVMPKAVRALLSPYIIHRLG